VSDLRFDLMTRASPEQVLEAMTDFTDRRLEIWSKTLDPKIYEVVGRHLGDCARRVAALALLGHRPLRLV
jgi:hypothetical protein